MALAPVAADDVFTTPAGWSVPLIGNLGADNGGGVDHDPDGQALGWVLGSWGTGEGAMFANGELGFLWIVQSGYVTMPVWTTTTYLTTAAGGTVELGTDGRFTYTAAAGYAGIDSFAYTLVDSGMATSTATVTIHVGGAAVPPDTGADTGTGTDAGLLGRSMRGTEAAEILEGTGAADTLHGMGGNDRLSGGEGDDRLSGGHGHDIVRGEGGADSVWGGNGRDRLYAGTGNDAAQGGFGADRLWGEAGDDRLSGGDGDDRVWGGGGQDRLRGDAGDDVLAGGAGRDALVGGAGADVFVLSLSSSRNADMIEDWSFGDRIGLSARALGLAAGPLPADWLAVEGAVPSDHARVLLSADGTRLLFDADGDAVTANRVMATFAAPVELTADSFVLL